jgi:hypothetical protein
LDLKQRERDKKRKEEDRKSEEVISPQLLSSGLC